MFKVGDAKRGSGFCKYIVGSLDLGVCPRTSR